MLFRWSYPDGAVLALHLVSAGTGYISGVLKFLADATQPGSGFLGIFNPGKIFFDSNSVSYSVSGGSLACVSGLYSCLAIIDGGRNYAFTAPLTLQESAFGPGDGNDPRCPLPACNPIDLSISCTINSDPVCWHLRIPRTVGIYYAAGCALDDSGCQNKEQTGSITAVHLFENGISHGCAAGPLMTGAGGYFQAKYNTNTTNGRITDVFFETADDRGQNIGTLPSVIVNDGACRCGTTITSTAIVLRGSGAAIL